MDELAGSGAGERAARVEALLADLEDLPDRVAREQAMEAVSALAQLYGEGLARVVERAGPEVMRSAAEDELVSHLLMIHDLHPIAAEARVREALEEVRPYMESHGGGVELLGVEDGVARVRLEGTCSGCPSSTMTLKLAIEDAVAKLAPEIERVEAEGVSEAEPVPQQLLQIETGGPSGDQPATNGVSAAGAGGGWTEVVGLDELAPGRTTVTAVAGEPVLFLRLEADTYAYRPRCPGCEASLEEATLRGTELRCSCGLVYDARRAGRCLDRPQLHLEPVPLLAGDGTVRVAVEGAAA